MKLFTILKIGYTHSSTYGCSGEYFNMIYTDGSKLLSMAFEGLYGVENRVKNAMTNKGFTFCYIPTDFGKMTKKEVMPMFKSEKEALETVEVI